LPISFPLSSKRKSGFLPPTVAFDTANGTEVTTPYYFDIAPNRDATLTPVYMAARGVNVGGEFRYLEPSYAGTARMSYMPADKLRSLDRWSGSLVHNGAMSTPIGGVGVALNISRVSDDDYWRDFPNATLAPGASPRLLPADVTASWGRGYFSSSVKVLKWQTLQDISAPITPPYDRVPQMTGRYARYNTAGFDWSIDGDFTQFESLSKLTGQPNAQRIFGLAQVSYPFIRPAGFITPKLQLHARGYQYDAIHNGSQTAASTVPTFSLDSGLVFERETTLGGRGLLQTLEPRAFYVNTPYVNKSLLPNYDTGLNDFNFATIFTENAYVGNDRISDNNLLTLGLTTRYLDADSGAQLARFGVAQRLRFADQLVTGALAGFSDVLLSAGVNLNERWMLDSMLQYNGKTDELGRAVVGARYSPGRNLGAGQGEGEGRYDAVGRVNYSLTEGRLINTVLGLEYDAGCWLGRVVLDRVQTSVNTSTSSVMFQLEFVGFTRLGLSPQKSLTTNISRYQNLRDTGSTLSRFSNYD
jgi:LPS-assembly protein